MVVTQHFQKNLEDTLLSYTKNLLDTVFDGDKFPNSFGMTREYIINHSVDYFTLRRRCYQLFIENTYFQGMIKRILRNEIFTGMFPEPTPIGEVLWPELSEDEQEKEASKYADLMNVNFALYASEYKVFDYKQEMTFGEFQEAVRQEAIICGDVVIVSRINHSTMLPCWDIISGNNIETPFEVTNLKKGHTITHGVERDAQGRHVAYHVKEYKDGEIKYTRIPTTGEKSGRQISWMVYGGNKLLNEVRGTPVLANALYMLRDLDRYRDAELRAAVLGSIIPFFIEKAANASPTGSGVLSKAALAKGTKTETTDKETPPQVDMIPGMVVDNLKPGETIKGFSPTHPNINFEKFQDVIINAIAWGCLEAPPETITMLFRQNYSASRQADNEFKITLKYRAFKNAKDFCQIIYEEYIIQETLLGEIQLPGFREIVFNPKKWKTRTAWLKCEWSAMSRPSVDIQKEAKAYIELIDNMNMTHDQACRLFTGMSFKAVCLIRAREKKLMQRLGLTAKVDEDSQGIPIDNSNLKVSSPEETTGNNEDEEQEENENEDESENENTEGEN